VTEWTAERLAAEVTKRGEDWSDKDAAASLLEETRHTVRAEVMADWPDDSNAGAETKACRDPRYRKHIEDMVEARRLSNRAKIKLEAIRTFADMYRTEQATRRAEAQIR
jgi:hypothetical protein